MLTDVMKLVCDPRATDETRRQAVLIAYNIGKCDGRCEGAASMGTHMMETMNKGLDRILAAVKP